MKRIRFFITTLLIPVFMVMVISLSFGDTVDYIYDDAGRLIKASKGNTTLFYQYDEVGNLLSISPDEGAPNPSPPSLSSISPDVFVAGATYEVVITGQNLRTTQSITSDNPALAFQNIAAIETRITATLSVSDNAAPGQANIAVITSYGSAKMAVNLYQVNITPAAISLFPASTGTVSVSLTPSAQRELIIPVANKNMDVVSTPQFTAVPAGGIADLPITGLKIGSGSIKIASAEAAVYVIESDVSLQTAVSVSFAGLPSNSTIYASAVSVDFSGSMPQGSAAFSSGVSVAVPYIINEIISAPVCVKILQ